MSEEIKNGNMSNVDALLASTYEQEVPSFLDTSSQDLTTDAPEHEPDVEKQTPSLDETINTEDHKELTSEVDEYGTEIKKPEKVYTEAEVQAMIRDRVSRMKQSQPEIQQPPQTQAQQEVIPEGDWEAQLESFIDHTLSKREHKIQEVRWQQQQQEQQVQFEIKFNEGAAKYSDFEAVVHGQPLTPQMVLATRGMNDPAAFIYAASKTQTKELQRISHINDPMTQALEMGQLAERMRKSRSNVSQAPRPIDAPKGDVVETKERTRNIDDKIQAEEARMRKERARR